MRTEFYSKLYTKFYPMFSCLNLTPFNYPKPTQAERCRSNLEKSISHKRRCKNLDYRGNISRSDPFLDRPNISFSWKYPGGSFLRLIPLRLFDTCERKERTRKKKIGKLFIPLFVLFYLFRRSELNGEDKQKQKFGKIVLKFPHIYQHPT